MELTQQCDYAYRTMFFHTLFIHVKIIEENCIKMHVRVSFLSLIQQILPFWLHTSSRLDLSAPQKVLVAKEKRMHIENLNLIIDKEWLKNIKENVKGEGGEII